MLGVELAGQVGIVTGASRGIGRAIARALASEGVALGLVGRDVALLDAVAPGARSYRADLAKAADVADLAARLAADFGRIHILVHAAGVHVAGRAEEPMRPAFDEQDEVNARAPEALTRALLPTLRANHGQVVFVNSSVAFHSRPDVGRYAQSKQALRDFADRLRDEVNPDVRVLSVYPGRTATPLQESIRREEGKTYEPSRFLQPDDIASVILHALRLPKTAEVTDIRIRPFQKVD